jgi:hypothetical protein
MNKLHFGEILDLLPDNQARALRCLQEAEKCRNGFFYGKQNTIDEMMSLPTRILRIRYGNYSKEARRKIAMKLWTSSTIAKELIGDEQMFARWAVMYASMVHSSNHVNL